MAIRKVHQSQETNPDVLAIQTQLNIILGPAPLGGTGPTILALSHLDEKRRQTFQARVISTLGQYGRWEPQIPEIPASIRVGETCLSPMVISFVRQPLVNEQQWLPAHARAHFIHCTTEILMDEMFDRGPALPKSGEGIERICLVMLRRIERENLSTAMARCMRTVTKGIKKYNLAQLTPKGDHWENLQLLPEDTRLPWIVEASFFESDVDN